MKLREVVPLATSAASLLLSSLSHPKGASELIARTVCTWCDYKAMRLIVMCSLWDPSQLLYSHTWYLIPQIIAHRTF